MHAACAALKVQMHGNATAFLGITLFGILPLFLCICIYQMTYVSVLSAALRVPY
jgi:hypothetical protein